MRAAKKLISLAMAFAVMLPLLLLSEVNVISADDLTNSSDTLKFRIQAHDGTGEKEITVAIAASGGRIDPFTGFAQGNDNAESLEADPNDGDLFFLGWSFSGNEFAEVDIKPGCINENTKFQVDSSSVLSTYDEDTNTVIFKDTLIPSTYILYGLYAKKIPVSSTIKFVNANDGSDIDDIVLPLDSNNMLTDVSEVNPPKPFTADSAKVFLGWSLDGIDLDFSEITATTKFYQYNEITTSFYDANTNTVYFGKDKILELTAIWESTLALDATNDKITFEAVDSAGVPLASPVELAVKIENNAAVLADDALTTLADFEKELNVAVVGCGFVGWSLKSGSSIVDIRSITSDTEFYVFDSYRTPMIIGDGVYFAGGNFNLYAVFEKSTRALTKSEMAKSIWVDYDRDRIVINDYCGIIDESLLKYYPDNKEKLIGSTRIMYALKAINRVDYDDEYGDNYKKEKWFPVYITDFENNYGYIDISKIIPIGERGQFVIAFRDVFDKPDGESMPESRLVLTIDPRPYVKGTPLGNAIANKKLYNPLLEGIWNADVTGSGNHFDRKAPLPNVGIAGEGKNGKSLDIHIRAEYPVKDWIILNRGDFMSFPAVSLQTGARIHVRFGADYPSGFTRDEDDFGKMWTFDASGTPTQVPGIFPASVTVKATVPKQPHSPRYKYNFAKSSIKARDDKGKPGYSNIEILLTDGSWIQIPLGSNNKDISFKSTDSNYIGNLLAVELSKTGTIFPPDEAFALIETQTTDENGSAIVIEDSSGYKYSAMRIQIRSVPTQRTPASAVQYFDVPTSIWTYVEPTVTVAGASGNTVDVMFNQSNQDADAVATVTFKAENGYFKGDLSASDINFSNSATAILKQAGITISIPKNSTQTTRPNDTIVVTFTLAESATGVEWDGGTNGKVSVGDVTFAKGVIIDALGDKSTSAVTISDPIINLVPYAA